MLTKIVSTFKALVYLGHVCLILAFPLIIQAQSYDLLLKGGHVIDPKNGIDTQMDVAIVDGKIGKVAFNIPPQDARQVVNCSGLFITPGLIDMHTHVFVGPNPGRFTDGSRSVTPDDFSFRSGVTTMVDAGSSGWTNFMDFKERVIDQSKTRVLVFLNIVGHGGARVGLHNEDLEDMNPRITASLVREYPDVIVGVKFGHFELDDWTPFERALEVGRITDSPLFIECHLPELSLVELLKRMRPGDILTHTLQTGERSPLDQHNQVYDYVFEAKERGVVFDVGHGGASFRFSVAIPAMKQGLMPDTFGTDLHNNSRNSGMKDMLNIMSKYLNMGMSMPDLILRATWNAALSLKREDLGHLSEGAVADLTVLGKKQGSYGFVDARGFRMDGDQKLEAELTLREGRIVWDLNGLTAEMWNE